MPPLSGNRALDHCQLLARRFRFFLQVDVRKFFPSIDHAIQWDQLARKVTDPGVLWLIDVVLSSGAGVLDDAYDMVYFPGDDLFAVCRSRGLPIGNLTSQFWANVYLNPVDHFIKRELRCRGYARYVDDLVMFAEEKRTLWAWKEALEERLEKYRLTIHPGAHPKPVGEGIPFLGFVIYPEHRRLKRRKGVHFQRRLQGLLKDYEAERLPEEELAAAIQGWDNHVRYANSVGLRKTLLSSVPTEVMNKIVTDLNEMRQ